MSDSGDDFPDLEIGSQIIRVCCYGYLDFRFANLKRF